MKHICATKLTIIGSDNGLSPGGRQTIISTNAVILLIRNLGTHFSEIWSEIRALYSRKSIWKCRLRNGGNFVWASILTAALRYPLNILIIVEVNKPLGHVVLWLCQRPMRLGDKNNNTWICGNSLVYSVYTVCFIPQMHLTLFLSTYVSSVKPSRWVLTLNGRGTELTN